MPVIIRRGVPADTDVVAEYNRAMALETEDLRLDPGTLRKGVHAVLSDENKGLYFVAELEGTVVGQLMVTREWSDWRNRDIWWIQSVYVHPDHRKRGLLRALFDAVERDARSVGVADVRLYVHHANPTAQNAYQRFGMKLSHYVIMEKSLDSASRRGD